MNQDDYRIIIPAKSGSVRAPGKNSLLLRWTLEYVERQGLSDKSVLLSANEGYLAEASSKGIKAIYEKENYSDQVRAIRQVIVQEGWEDKFILVLQPTQPFRQHWLVARCLQVLRKNGSAIVTTKNRRPKKQFDFVAAGDSYSVKVGSGVDLTCAVFGVASKYFTEFSNHILMWESLPVLFVDHLSPCGSLDFDWPEDMYLANGLSKEMIDQIYYSEK